MTVCIVYACTPYGRGEYSHGCCRSRSIYMPIYSRLIPPVYLKNTSDMEDMCVRLVEYYAMNHIHLRIMCLSIYVKCHLTRIYRKQSRSSSQFQATVQILLMVSEYSRKLFSLPLFTFSLSINSFLLSDYSTGSKKNIHLMTQNHQLTDGLLLFLMVIRDI